MWHLRGWAGFEEPSNRAPGLHPFCRSRIFEAHPWESDLSFILILLCSCCVTWGKLLDFSGSCLFSSKVGYPMYAIARIRGEDVVPPSVLVFDS